MIAKIYPDNNVRYFDIRKFTPRECFRLMGVDDSDIDKLMSGSLSKTACYKLAGNSIVVHCLYEIYKSLYFGNGQSKTKKYVQGDLFADNSPKHASLPCKLNVVTLCSGYDSQCLGLKRLKEYIEASPMVNGGDPFDFNLVAWSEFDPETPKVAIEKQPAVVAHNLLFPQWADRNVGDMTKADWTQFEGTPIDLLTYSTPCQSISQAGKQEGMSKDSGTRSAVLWYTEEAIRILKPKILLQENVKALINKKNKPDFDEWRKTVEKYNYTNYYTVMNSKNYGVPQNRDRVFMISIRNDLGIGNFTFPEPHETIPCIADIIEDVTDPSFFLKPDAVIKFLDKNETENCLYSYTDHKLTDEEIAEIRKNHTSSESV